MEIVMITAKDIIVNLSILTAYLFISSQMFKSDYIMGASRSIWSKICIGVRNGILGMLLMIFTVRFSDITILDFRQLAMIYAGYLGGFYSALITSLFIAAMRLFAFGPISSVTIAATISNLAIGIGIGVICTRHLIYWKKWALCLLIGMIGTSVVLIFNFGLQGIVPSLLYIMMMLLGGTFTSYLLSFLIQTNAYHYRLKKEATTDFLTGLGNYRTFDAMFNTVLRNEDDHRVPLSLLMIDIDYFKKINDVHGHLNGDAILTQLGMLLKKVTRPFETPSRIGGEEFAVLLHHCPHPQALALAEQIRHAVEHHMFKLINEEPIQITVSIGVATFPETALEELKSVADQALYKAKHNGRNQVVSTLGVR
ncbi:GGDEF domain-containing protein [Paenibacillus rigui]|uniref:Diguanylate cyclase n=1 Tax=Paenibacillus rigui TaxID=554312 RepID=A0A229ULT8_9BACL|nr:diguanylate cyclase [Paenibacillus rigui]OXM84343.1 diguanylate cyclase [Paenibacillus rigui]